MSKRSFTSIGGAFAAAAVLLTSSPALAAPESEVTVKERLAGADRFDTAVAVSRSAFPDTASVVYVASGVNFPDALSAGPSAATEGGPLLLTRPDILPAAVREEIARLKPVRIVVAGGVDAISSRVEQDLAAIATVSRIAGADRFTTSIELAKATFPKSAPRVYLATGRDFPDALSAGAAAATVGGPVLLVNGENSELDPATVAELKRLSPQTITVVGGWYAVSDGILSQVKALAPTTRIAGDDRYETSAAIAKDAFAAGTPLDATNAYLASGWNFPDALVGSAIAGKNKQPLLVAQSDCRLDATTDALKALRISEVTLLGGPNAIDFDSPRPECLINETPMPSS